MYHVCSLVGPPGHGKSTLLQCPTEYYMASMDVSKHVVERSSNTFLEIWDTPGLHRFDAARDHCLRRCDAHLLVIKSGESVDVYWDELIERTPGIWVLLVVQGEMTDVLTSFAARKNISYAVVKEPNDAWEAAEMALHRIVPRLKICTI